LGRLIFIDANYDDSLLLQEGRCDYNLEKAVRTLVIPKRLVPQQLGFDCTIGQPDASRAMTGGSYSLTGGYWALISVVQTPGLPNLTIRVVGPNSVVVSRPDTGSYTLQQNSSVGGGGWMTSGYAITTANGTNSITITPPTANLFFRLSI
jgi:hypothetical protein